MPSLPEAQQADLRSQALEALVRTESIEGLIAFNELILLNPARPHHREMLEFLWDCIVDRENGLALLPRGGAKTTHGTIGLGAWLVANFKDIAIGLMSNTQTQADAFSRAIRNTVELNPRCVEVFGNLKAPDQKWTDAEWMRKDSGLIEGTNNSTMYARGVGGAIISKRFDIILIDDILDEENSNSPEAVEKVETWLLQTVLPCLKPDGVVIGLGTRWATEDVYGTLIKPIEDGGKGWRSLVVPALTGDLADKDSLVSYWPDYWPVVKLLKRWQDLGTPMFLCAYQNDVSGLAAGDVFPSKFEYFDDLPEGHHFIIRMGVDLASSEKERADYTARVTTAEDTETGDFYVLSAYRDKRATHHVEFIHDGWLAYPNMDMVEVEDQQFQSTLIQQVMQDYPRIPIEGVTSDKDKTTRARAVAAKYEAGKVKHRRSLKDSDFERELRSFTPKGAGHDDFVDALGFSMDMGGDEFVFTTVRRR